MEFPRTVGATNTSPGQVLHEVDHRWLLVRLHDEPPVIAELPHVPVQLCSKPLEFCAFLKDDMREDAVGILVDADKGRGRILSGAAAQEAIIELQFSNSTNSLVGAPTVP